MLGVVTGGKNEVRAILVIEDDEDVRQAMVAILEMKGYSVASAENGKVAMDYLRAAPIPDLIITDLSMPVMDGRQFRREQVKDARLANVPLLVITAMNDRNGIDANEILRKPVDVDHLLATVSRYCEPESTPR
jgi:CheY-like chemotaxis protein